MADGTSERPTVEGARWVACLCGREHMIVAIRWPDNEPIIECAVVDPGKEYRFDTRYLMVSHHGRLTRVFTGYDGPLWVRAPSNVGRAR